MSAAARCSGKLPDFREKHHQMSAKITTRCLRKLLPDVRGNYYQMSAETAARCPRKLLPDVRGNFRQMSAEIAARCPRKLLSNFCQMSEERSSHKSDQMSAGRRPSLARSRWSRGDVCTHKPADVRVSPHTTSWLKPQRTDWSWQRTWEDFAAQCTCRCQS